MFLNFQTNSVFSDDIDAFPDVVELNVGGRYFATSVETLTRCKGSVLADLFSGDPRSLPRDKDGRYSTLITESSPLRSYPLFSFTY